MKERPIIFSGKMVRAILDSRKTQTRRVMKPQPVADSLYAGGGWTWCLGKPSFIGASDGLFQSTMIQHCPYGVLGDRLWVRETWKPNPKFSSGGIPRMGISFHGGIEWKEGNPDQSGPWKSSIHMPRWASRILLEITDIRIERLQEISKKDMEAEGVQGDVYGEEIGIAPTEESHSASIYFRELWDSINAKRGYGWETNPWCWCISFKKLDGCKEG